MKKVIEKEVTICDFCEKEQEKETLPCRFCGKDFCDNCGVSLNRGLECVCNKCTAASAPYNKRIEQVMGDASDKIIAIEEEASAEVAKIDQEFVDFMKTSE